MPAESIELTVVTPGGPGSNRTLKAILAAGRAAPRYVLLLSRGAHTLPGTVGALRQALDERPSAGAAGALILDERGSFRASHAAFPSLAHELLAASGLGRSLFGPWFPSHSLAHSADPCVADWVSGACMLVRREAMAATGLFDPQLSEVDGQIEWCFRLRRAAWALLYVPTAVAVCEPQSAIYNESQLMARYRSRVRLLRRLHGPATAGALKLLLAALAALGRLQPLNPRQLRAALRDA